VASSLRRLSRNGDEEDEDGEGDMILNLSWGFSET